MYKFQVQLIVSNSDLWPVLYLYYYISYKYFEIAFIFYIFSSFEFLF